MGFSDAGVIKTEVSVFEEVLLEKGGKVDSSRPKTMCFCDPCSPAETNRQGHKGNRSEICEKTFVM